MAKYDVSAPLTLCCTFAKISCRWHVASGEFCKMINGKMMSLLFIIILPTIILQILNDDAS